MRKLKFQIQGRELALSAPMVSTGSKLGNVARTLNIAALVLLMFTFLFLPLSIFLGNVTYENSVFGFFLTLIIIIAGLTCSYFVLVGRKGLVDPEHFLSVLFFALVVITSSVFQSPAHISNTFGTANVRALAGILIMAFIGLFYFTNVLIKSKQLFNSAVKAILIGLFVTVVFAVVNSLTLTKTLPFDNLPIMFVALMGIVYSIIAFKKYRLPLLLVLVVSLILLFGVNSGTPLNSINIIRILLPAFITTIIVGILIYRNVSREYFKKFQLVFSLKGQKIVKSFDILNVLMVGLPLLFLIVLLVLLFTNNISIAGLLDPINNSLTVLNNYFRTTTFNLGKLLIGNGAYDVNTVTSNLNAAVSLLRNVIMTEGVLGLFGYLFLWMIGISAAVKGFTQSIKDKEMLLTLPLVFVLIFVPIYSLFAYSGVLLVILWWASFALIVRYSAKFSDKEESWEIRGMLLKNRKGRAVKLILVLLIIAFALFSLVSFSSVTT